MLATFFGLVLSSAASAQFAMKFGFDAVPATRAQARSQLKTAKASGVTPVVQWFYRGDDISPD